jgi:hypothetical protein
MLPRLDPASAPLRSPPDVRASVDLKLGYGQGLGVDEACALLTPVERVEWMLGELLISLFDRRFHIWVQSFAEGAADWPARYRSVLEVAEALAPGTVAPVRWAVERGAQVRAGTGGVALFSFEAEVCLGQWEGVKPWLEATVARWPEDLDPCALAAATARPRRIEAPRAAGPKYPQARVGYSPRGTACPWQAQPNRDSVVEVTCAAAWKAGASDAALAELFQALGAAREQLPEVCAAWVSFDGDGGDAARFQALREQLFPRHPLAQYFGIERLEFPFLGLVAEVDFAALSQRLAEAAPFLWLGDRPAISVEQELLSALRQDPDGLCLHASHLTADVETLLLRTLETGHAVLLGGTSPRLEAFVSRAQTEARVPVHRRA